MLKVNLSMTVGPQLEKLKTALSDGSIQAFMESQIPNMVAQVRKNIVQLGGLKGEWTPLSRPYAKRKREGKTPGKGRFGYAMLRDTGAMYQGLTGIVRRSSRGWMLVLDAKGSKKGITNGELLYAHATGAGRLPKRNPAQDMTLFTNRFTAALTKMLGGSR